MKTLTETILANMDEATDFDTRLQWGAMHAPASKATG